MSGEVDLTNAAGEPAVLTEQRGRVLVITLNRPEAKNAINGALSHGLAAAIETTLARMRASAGGGDRLDPDAEGVIGGGGSLRSRRPART